MSYAGNSFTVDDITVTDSASTPPAADYSLAGAPPPPPDKVVNISGVYPHLVMTNTHDECGVGAVVPWAGKLWAITYGPHLPNGSSDKLYEIAPDLSRVIRPESVGGTPANRFIHTASNQLNIGPYFIDAARNVRVIPPSLAPGRHTATAAHLTDPNRLYLFTMEDGVYDINATDLTFITRYPDVQGKGDRFLFGYHGKGAYTGQGLFVVANNGRPNSQETPTGPAGVLATWNGTTVAQNGGTYFATNDPNNTAEENTVNPVDSTAKLHRRLEPDFQNTDLRSHRPRRHLRKSQPRHRSHLGHRLRCEIRPAPRHGKPAVAALALAERLLLARRLPRLAHRVAAHPPARSRRSWQHLSDAHARTFLSTSPKPSPPPTSPDSRRFPPTTRCPPTTPCSTARSSWARTTPPSSPTPSPRKTSPTSGSAPWPTSKTGALPPATAASG